MITFSKLSFCGLIAQTMSFILPNISSQLEIILSSDVLAELFCSSSNCFLATAPNNPIPLNVDPTSSCRSLDIFVLSISSFFISWSRNQNIPAAITAKDKKINVLNHQVFQNGEFIVNLYCAG